MDYLLKVVANETLILGEDGWCSHKDRPVGEICGEIPFGTILYVNEFKIPLHFMFSDNNFLNKCVARGVDGFSLLSFIGTIDEFEKACHDVYNFTILEDNRDKRDC